VLSLGKLKRKSWSFVAVQAAITIGVLALITFPLGALGPPSIPSSCANQDELWGPGYGYNDSSSATPVLVMQPGSTGFICVVYRSQSNGGETPGASAFTFLVANFRIYGSTCTTQGGGLGCNFYQSSNFVIGSRQLVSTQPFVDNSTETYYAVVYSVMAMRNATGYYPFSAPEPGCGGFPMAVGHSASGLNAADFPGSQSPLTCPIGDFPPVEVGVIGIQVTTVDFPNP